MPISEKVILLDFCETVVKFQTADRYVEYSTKNINSIHLSIRKFIYRFIYRIGFVRYIEKNFPSLSFNKRCILYLLKGIPKLDLYKSAEIYYRDFIRPNFISQTIENIKQWQNQGYRIIILSGGYDIYLNFFAEEFGIDDLICTRIKFDENQCLGTFSSIDCLGTNKIRLLEDYIKHHRIVIDKEESIAVSDSATDLPMLNYVNNQLIVYHKGNNAWFYDYGYDKFLIWS